MPATQNPDLLATLIEPLAALVAAAGEAIMTVYGGAFSVTHKADDSPLTQADLAAHALISAGLAQLPVHWPLLSEESAPEAVADRRSWPSYWLLDPLDGTKEFVNRNGEFTVNLALIHEGAAVLGLVGVPARQQLYLGCRALGLAQRRDLGSGQVQVLRGQAFAGQRPRLVVSRSHGNARQQQLLAHLQARFPDLQQQPVGSALKLCLLAEGGADFYPRLGPTSEWDIAAAQAVLEAAGGSVLDLAGQPLGYNQRDSLLNPDFIAQADAGYDWRGQLPDWVRTGSQD